MSSLIAENGPFLFLVSLCYCDYQKSSTSFRDLVYATFCLHRSIKTCRSSFSDTNCYQRGLGGRAARRRRPMGAILLSDFEIMIRWKNMKIENRNFRQFQISVVLCQHRFGRGSVNCSCRGNSFPAQILFKIANFKICILQ